MRSNLQTRWCSNCTLSMCACDMLAYYRLHMKTEASHPRPVHPFKFSIFGLFYIIYIYVIRKFYSKQNSVCVNGRLHETLTNDVSQIFRIQACFYKYVPTLSLILLTLKQLLLAIATHFFTAI